MMIEVGKRVRCKALDVPQWEDVECLSLTTHFDMPVRCKDVYRLEQGGSARAMGIIF